MYTGIIIIIAVIILTICFLKLEKECYSDSLTHLLNRKFFNLFINRRIKKYIKVHEDLGIISIDIDHFKHYNDTYGHQEGDYILTQISAILKENVRDKDKVVRLGGDEFIILAQNTNVIDNVKLSQRVTQAFKKSSQIIALNKKYNLPLTISIGVENLSKIPIDQTVKSKQLIELLKYKLCERTDQLLYQAKHNGRDQICFYKEI